jgi:hypothetical protein
MKISNMLIKLTMKLCRNMLRKEEYILCYTIFVMQNLFIRTLYSMI